MCREKAFMGILSLDSFGATTSSAFCSISSKIVDCLRAANEDLVEGNVDLLDVSLWLGVGGRRERGTY